MMKSQQRRDLRLGLLFISPWIVGALVFVVFPALLTLYYSFTDYSLLAPPVFIGMGNYADLVTDEVFHRSLLNTFLFGAVVMPLMTVFALALAILISGAYGARRIFRTLIFLPSLVPMVAVAILWSWIYNDQHGIMNFLIGTFFSFFGLGEGALAAGPDWTSDPNAARMGLMVAMLWGVGQPMVIYMAGLQEIPRGYYEEAIVDGAGPWQQIRHITIPLLTPLIYFNVLMGIVGVLQIFTLPFVMMGPTGPPVQSTLFLVMYIYDQAFLKLNMGYACAMAWVLFLLVATLTWLAHRVLAGRVTYDAG